ncbi:spermatogenesis associated 6-like protein isoform X3 [Scyliorhinus torazame]|uniref:spermatogenesis associated 6-like protein isoform X3 n=1 Tax=Scyliorhinus torazame TaxID=75743 RepID=UPI003B5C377A
MPQKVLKCVIQLEIHAVTCPGVILSRRDDVYINIRVLGQYWKTKCVMPVFPLLIHERIQFEKVFGKEIIDPADVAAFLECDGTKFELMQYCPSVDENLASYEDNTRNFLFPEPKLTPSYPGVDREVLMKRCSPVFLISPKLEFSTTTTITECSPRSAKKISSSLCLSESGRKENQVRRPRSAKSFNLIGKSCTDKKGEKERKKPVATRSRSLSPYCRKCLLELCLDDLQHSSPRKSDPIGRTPFVNRSVEGAFGAFKGIIRSTTGGWIMVNLARSEVTFLGHTIGHGEMAPRNVKTKARGEFPIPSTRREILRFLDMNGFYRKFMPNVDSVLAPLTELPKKCRKFQLPSECQVAFDYLKTVLTTTPALATLNYTK